MKYLFALALYLCLGIPLFAGSWYESSSGQKVDPNTIWEKASNFDLIIFGEDHGSSEAHKEELKFLESLSKLYPVSLSLEMLERDQAVPLKEFWKGQISESGFLKNSKFWKNYETDYHPMVVFSKENQLPVLASNCPRRYANKVFAEGLDSLFSDWDSIPLGLLPPPYSIRFPISAGYREKITSAAGHHTHGSSENLVEAQMLWDACMADSIATEVSTNKRKVFHLNGKFHSDEGFGVPARLRNMGFKVLVLSTTVQDSEGWKSEYSKLADYVYWTSE